MNPSPICKSTIGPMRWTVPSSKFKDNGITYEVAARVDTGELVCNCPARTVCWHIKAVASGAMGKPRVRCMPPAPAPAKQRPPRPAPRLEALPVDDLFGDGGAVVARSLQAVS